MVPEKPCLPRVQMAVTCARTPLFPQRLIRALGDVSPVAEHVKAYCGKDYETDSKYLII